jgi:hypothetical protein
MNEYMSSPFCVWDLLYSDLMGPPPGVKTNKFKKSNEYDQNSRRQVEYDMLKIGMRRCGTLPKKVLRGVTEVQPRRKAFLETGEPQGLPGEEGQATEDSVVMVDAYLRAEVEVGCHAHGP